jgi:heat shock protein HtpX
MSRSPDRVFRVSYRVQVAGVASLVAVPVILGAVTWLLVDVSPGLAVGVGLAFIVGLQAAVAKRWTGLRPKTVSPEDVPQIHATVERLCVTGDLAKPKIVLHDTRYANSWIKGLTSGRTTLHLTSRLVELLDEHQLEAVIGHELSHVGQRDSALMSAVGAPVAAMLDGAGLYFHTPIAVVRAIRASKPSRATPSKPAEHYERVLKSSTRSLPNDQMRNLAAASIGPLAEAGILWVFLLPVGLLFVVVGGMCRAVTAMFSRARELEADAGAARLTGNPAALASALIALSGASPDTIPLADLRRAASLDVFHIVAIGREYPLVHTHPPLTRRLKQLAAIETRLQSPEPG